MALVTPPRATLIVSSTYEVGGPSTIAIEGPSSPLPAPGLPVPPTMIKDLSTHLGNLEYKHGVLMRKMEEVSDAEVADNITIGEIHPRVATVKEQIVMENPNHLNDPNVSEGDQAPAAPDGFAPQWIEEMDDDDWEDDVEWLMAPMTPPRATITVSSTYEAGGPSIAAIEGSSFPLPTPGLYVPPTVIEDLSTRLGNLECKHGVLMRKMKEVSDAEVADSIATVEIHPRVATVGEQVQVMKSQAVQVVSELKEIETRVQQVQTLQTALHGTELQNQQLRTRVAEMESHVGILMSYMLWMEERLTVLEKRLSGPPPGPQ
nr:hypothetical protein [Tanacetum cinerariifolium]